MKELAYHIGVLRGFLCAHDAPYDVLAAINSLHEIALRNEPSVRKRYEGYKLGDYAKSLIEGSRRWAGDENG